MLLSKIEDLNRMVSGMRQGEKGGTIACDAFTEKTFTAELEFTPLQFVINSGGALCVDLIFSLKSASNFNITIKIYLSGAQFDIKSYPVEGGTLTLHHNCFSAYAEKGQYVLGVSISADGGGEKQIVNCQAKLQGDVGYVSGKFKLVAFEDTYLKFAYSDSDYIYQKAISGEEMFLMRRVKNRGDFTYGTLMHFQQGNYDTVFACCDEGKLYITILPYHSDIVGGTTLIAENVTCVTSAKSFNPNGCAVYYLSGGYVYFMLLQKDDVSGEIIVSLNIKLEYCPLATAVTAVSGMGGGWGYILSEKPRKNTLKLFDGNFFQSGNETASAQIAAQIEDLT